MHAEKWRDAAYVAPERFSSVATDCRNNQVLSHMGISAMSYAVFVNSWQFSLLYNSENMSDSSLQGGQIVCTFYKWNNQEHKKFHLVFMDLFLHIMEKKYEVWNILVIYEEKQHIFSEK